MALTSPPAQKPRPAPVSTTAPTAGSSASRGSASSSASSIGRDIAFSRSGRLRVSTATPSLIDFEQVLASWVARYSDWNMRGAT